LISACFAIILTIYELYCRTDLSAADRLNSEEQARNERFAIDGRSKVMKGKGSKKILIDRKSKLTVGFFYLLNKIVSRWHFKTLLIEHAENIPRTGSFLLIANHTSRWDGPVLMETIGRSANWMVSPNELLGLQGLLLRSVGAFPADRRFELLKYVAQQISKGEPIVIFPEGNIFKDGTTHPFKSGAARILVMCKEMGIDLPVVSVSVNYLNQHSVQVSVAEPVHFHVPDQVDMQERVRSLTDQMYTKLSSERVQLEYSVRSLEPKPGLSYANSNEISFEPDVRAGIAS
jgi:1-acyl-sn-glycerol-3-phosphate acyltransferase